ncbi:transposase [Mycobacterium sp. BMJ-28]
MRYSEEFRRKVLDLAPAGRPIAQIAADLDISDQTIYSWPPRSSSTPVSCPGSTAPNWPSSVRPINASASWRPKLPS